MKTGLRIKTILYVTTHLVGSQRFLSWCAYPSIWYSRIQNKVLEILDKHKEAKSFIKFYPVNVPLLNPNIDWIKEKNKNILLDSLVNILKNSRFDLIVTEASATTLLEILCTKSQILAFIPKDFVKINLEDKELLKKRVFLAESEDNYLDTLNHLIDPLNPLDFKDINDEFLFKYGIGSPDEEPYDLAKHAIQEIISKSSTK